MLIHVIHINLNIILTEVLTDKLLLLINFQIGQCRDISWMLSPDHCRDQFPVGTPSPTLYYFYICRFELKLKDLQVVICLHLFHPLFVMSLLLLVAEKPYTMMLRSLWCCWLSKPFIDSAKYFLWWQKATSFSPVLIALQSVCFGIKGSYELEKTDK